MRTRASPRAGAGAASRHLLLRLLAMPAMVRRCNRVAADTYSVFMPHNFTQGEFNAAIACAAHVVKLFGASIK